MIIGITGGIGCGKSTVLKFISEKVDAIILLTDEIAKELMLPGTNCYKEIIEHFGLNITNSDNTINPKKLSNIVFKNKEELHKLNEITHKEVFDYIRNIISQNSDKIIIIESALLLDSEFEKECDHIWYIYTKKELRIKRLIENRGYNIEKIEDIIKNQPNENYFKHKCDYIIENNNIEEMKKQVNYAIQKMLKI